MNLKSLHKISYGLYVVSSRKGEKINGQTANAIMQVTSEPPSFRPYHILHRSKSDSTDRLWNPYCFCGRGD